MEQSVRVQVPPTTFKLCVFFIKKEIIVIISIASVSNNSNFGRLKTPIAANGFSSRTIKLMKENCKNPTLLYLQQPPGKFKLLLTNLYIKLGKKMGFIPINYDKFL